MIRGWKWIRGNRPNPCTCATPSGPRHCPEHADGEQAVEVNASAAGLNAELAKALGLPKHTLRAVLVLQAGELPRLELTMHATNLAGNLVLEGAGAAARLAKVKFMLRLERFPGDTPC